MNKNERVKVLPSVLLQQQFGRKDRVLQQKLEETQQRAQEVGRRRVDERELSLVVKSGSRRRLQVKPVSCCIMGLKQNDTGYI